MGVMTVPDEPTGLVQKFWRASLRVLGATLALWFSVRLLLRIWWVLATVAALILAAVGLYRWWRWRGW
jgi:hypothetical protein